MSMLVWVMMAIAIWHFTVFVPDQFYGGIVGAFVAAIIGAIVLGLAVSGLSIPSHNPTGLEQALIAIPGSIAGLLICYVYGAVREGQRKRQRDQARRRR
jgi:hypothetical protein